MPFNFSHRPTRRKEPSPWFENALLLAVAGSIIAVMGQLAGTILPIMYGPADISDFEISTNPVALYVPSYQGSPIAFSINATDFHHWLRPYKYSIFLRVEAPEGFDIGSDDFQIKAGESSDMIATISKRDLSFGIYQILIQGIGGDGKIRNTTLYIYYGYVITPEGYLKPEIV